jgi:hypothetical protein
MEPVHLDSVHDALEIVPPAFGIRFINGMAYAFVHPCAMKVAVSWFVENRGLEFGTILDSLTVGSALPSLAVSLTSLSCRNGVVVTSGV